VGVGSGKNMRNLPSVTILQLVSNWTSTKEKYYYSQPIMEGRDEGGTGGRLLSGPKRPFWWVGGVELGGKSFIHVWPISSG